MIEVGILKNFDSGTYKAGVQLAGSLTTYFDDISVAKNIPSSALVIGNYVIVAIPGGNPRDACVIATWPQGSPGGGGSKIQDADADTALETEQSVDEDKIHGKVKGVEAFLIEDDGILTYAKQSAVMAKRQTSYQSLPASVWTKVELNGVDFDIQGEFDYTTNYRFTAKRAGIYIAAGNVYVVNMPDASQVNVGIYKNGTRIAMTTSFCSVTGKDLVPFIITAVQLNADDYLELWTTQNSGSTKNIHYGPGLTVMSVVKVT